jgi:hypothetical protein
MTKVIVKEFKAQLLSIAILTILLGMLFLAGNFPLLIEKYYANGLYPIISTMLHFTFNWLAFSIGDVLYAAIILYLIYQVWQIVHCVIKRTYRRLIAKILNIIAGFQVFILAFYLLWGMNYFRPPAAEILKLKDQNYTLTELLSVTRLLIDSTNYARYALKPAELQSSNNIVFAIAKQAISQATINHTELKSHYPASKPALFTPLLNYMGVSGYFTPFTGEAQVNFMMPLVNKPVTACHEMAHQMGFAREDEANFVGFIAGIKSKNELLKYSAYFLAMQEFMQQVRTRDTAIFNQLKIRIAVPVKNDIKNDQLYWKSYQNQIRYITGLFYDQYLKANNQPEGLQTYNRMINLTMAYYRQELTKQ